MAVLIKNFDMPHDCNVCPMHKIENPSNIVCKANGKKLNQKLYYLARDYDCPLEDIPDASDTTFSTTGKPSPCNLCKFEERLVSELPCCNCHRRTGDYFEAGELLCAMMGGK